MCRQCWQQRGPARDRTALLQPHPSGRAYASGARLPGQLAGSLGAAAFHLALRRAGGAAAPALQHAPLLAAAALLETAGRLAARLAPARAGAAPAARDAGASAKDDKARGGGGGSLLVRLPPSCLRMRQVCHILCIM
jgi:hypothetical protein